jgi:peptidoglycan/LPS O-acetylase OafA/YrhL
VEEQFYLFLPILILFTPRKWTPVNLGIGVMLGIGARWFFYSGGNNVTAAYVLTPCRSDALLLGVLGAWAMRQPNIVQWISTNREKSTWVFMVFLLGIIGFALSPHNYDAKGMVLYGQTWFALFYSFLLLVVVSFKTGAIATLMRFVPLRYLGRISYGVYLLHMVVKSLVLTFLVENPNSWTAVLAATALTIGLATILYYLVEAPCVRIGHRFGQQRVRKKLAEKVSTIGEPATILSAQ